uniref:Ycf27 n=1 Tax=Phaeocystis rex TaxID=1631189 RepID=UPI002410E70B|nr:Ycf27 [Phaeocystis rex]WEL35979.1 Ycf27 [Phaeocystis rex]
MGELKTILVADTNVSILQFLKIRLSYFGYSVIAASNGEEVFSAFKNEDPDLIILDIMLAKIDGYKICTIIRKISQVPIILLTALANITDRIRGLDLGADKYLTKPFLPMELEACIHSLLFLPHGKIYFNSLVLQSGDLKLDTIKKHVFKDNKLINLTLSEFNLLKLFVNKSGKILTRTAVLDYIWGCTSYRYIDIRVVDVYVSRLRSKLKQESRTSNLILTVRGKGYIFKTVKN